MFDFVDPNGIQLEFSFVDPAKLQVSSEYSVTARDSEDNWTARAPPARVLPAA